MKLFAILVTITLVAVLGVSCTPPPTMVGCYVDSTGFYDLSYDGPMGGVGSFANATLWNSDDGTCSLSRRSGVTLVVASSASEAVTACTTAPDATATSVLPMDELNWEGLHGKNLWVCQGENQLFLVFTEGMCGGVSIGGAEFTIQYFGPKNSLNNASFSPGLNPTCQTPAMLGTVVYQPTFSGAKDLCSAAGVPNFVPVPLDNILWNNHPYVWYCQPHQANLHA